VTLVTQTVVDKDDPAFKNPVKRVGKIYTAEEAEALKEEKGWVFKEEKKSRSGWRRVVPSPEPKNILNVSLVEKMARQGTIVITAGGGGIPVYIDEKEDIRPSEAVIDKDNASSLLGSLIKADEFYILTDVPYVYLNYGKDDQQIAEFMNVADARKHLGQGMFGEGSMSPKIEAAIGFVERGGQKSVITEATQLQDKKYGSKITMEYED